MSRLRARDGRATMRPGNIQMNNADRNEQPGAIANGTVRRREGTERVYYDGYWLRYYAPPEDNPAEKKLLLESLARRTFHHTESGINTPGHRLEGARIAYDAEPDPARKRANGAMLAGAYFNRAIDILNVISELAEDGVIVGQDNELMTECVDCLRKAQEFGKRVKHYSGEEGIDELWEEPLRAFTTPMTRYYESRYVKIAQCMRDIDGIVAHMIDIFGGDADFAGAVPALSTFADAARDEVETARGDPVIFTVWPCFVAASEAITAFGPWAGPETSDHDRLRIRTGRRLLRRGRDVISYIAGARVPMPKTTREYLQSCDQFAAGELDLDIP